MPIPVGSPAPDFTLLSKTAEGLKPVTLSTEYSAGPVVLLFVPAAFTHVCTAELCDTSAGLNSLGEVKVFGVSSDTPFALEAWAKQARINIPLLSDYQRTVTAAYEVVLADLAGLGPSTARAAFVIDSSGIVRYSELVPTLELPNFEAVAACVAAL